MGDFEKVLEQEKELSGVLTLSAMAEPALRTGSYTITAGQKLEIDSSLLSQTVRRFTVEAESVTISPNQIYSVFPPNNSAGQYEETLPHVVLNRRTLPWERAVDPKNPHVPWLCLLVFSDDEPIKLQDGKYGELCKDGNAFVPDLSGAKPTNETDCKVIDIPVDIFADILPMAQDLPYLAHVRDVSLDCKVTDKEVTNGGFACVISNRYPKAPEHGSSGVGHTAVLVSLDGFNRFFGMNANSRKKELSDKNVVRMFVFTVWNFFCEGRPFNFAAVARSLDVACSKIEGNVEILKNGTLKDIIKKGYYPMNHTFREGTRGISFYRPPLLPCRPAFENNGFGRYADELLRFDPALGMYDTSHSAAWQLGRLLSLQDELLAKDILAWRIRDKQTVAENQNGMTLSEAVAPFVQRHKDDTPKQGRRRRGETLDGEEWRAVVPDIERTVGVTETVDIEGANLPEKAVENLLSDDVGKLIEDVSSQRELLEAFEVI